MNKFLFFILAEILYCAYSLDPDEAQNPSHPGISSRSRYDLEYTVKIVEIIRGIINTSGCAGLVQFLQAAASQSFKATFMTVAKNSIIFAIDNENFNLQFVHPGHKLQGAKNPHLFKIDVIVDPLALDSCAKLFKKFNFGYMKAVVKTHIGIQEYLPKILSCFNHINKLDLEVDHIADETMQKLSNLELRQFYIGVAELKLEHLRNLLNFKSLVMEIIADSLQIDSLSQITPIVLNKACHKCVIKIQGHSSSRPQGAFMASELNSQQTIVKIILDNLNPPSSSRSFWLELSSMFFHPICTEDSSIEELTLNLDDELYVNELLWCCVGLESLNLKLERIVKGFSFMRSENLYPTLKKFRISVKENVNLKAQTLNEALHRYKCLRDVNLRINFTDSSGENVFHESLIPSLEALTIDSNALDEKFFKRSKELYELEDVDINWRTNITTVHTMTMLSDLTVLPVLTNLSLDRVSNAHEWQILDNCRDLLSLEIIAPIDFRLITSVDSQLYRTLESLSISLETSIMQHVRLNFVKLEYLSLEVTSENNNCSVNDEAVRRFMQANFDGGINETLTTLILRQSTSFDLTLLSMFNFPVLTHMCLKISDPYERGHDEEFCKDFYSQIARQCEFLEQLHFIFKCSQQHLAFHLD